MRRALLTTAALALVLGGTAACGSESEAPDPAGSRTTESATAQADQADQADQAGAEAGAADAPVTEIDVQFDGDQVTPQDERVQVPVGQTVAFVITSEEPGEIHLHSTPEQELDYEGGGRPQTFDLSFDRPGIIEVESHTLDKTIVSLEVS